MGTDLPRSAALSGASVHRIRVRIFIRSPPPIELAWRAICGPVGSLGGALRRCQIVVLVRALSDFISGRGSWDPSSASIGINREAIGPPVCATRLSTQLQRNHGSAKAHSEFACARPERASRRSSALRLAYPPRYDPCAYAREECRGPSEPAGQDAPWWCLQAPRRVAQRPYSASYNAPVVVG